MSPPSFDLDAYLRRTGAPPGLPATRETLDLLVRRHTESIPFENVDPWLGRPVRLDVTSLQDKLVRAGRGGYCYEQNHLLRHALGALGFQVSGLAARVLWELPVGTVTPRSHMLMRVELDEGPCLVDVGFGGLTLTSSLRLVPHEAQATAHERFRLVPAGDELVMEAELRGEWRPLYRFDLREQAQPDYEVYNWYVSTHPASRFVKGLIATRAEPGRRYALRDNVLTVHPLGGEAERRLLTTGAQVREALEGPLRVRLPEAPGLDDALERLAQGRPE